MERRKEDVVRFLAKSHHARRCRSGRYFHRRGCRMSG
jgi:hypothetical protein